MPDSNEITILDRLKIVERLTERYTSTADIALMTGIGHALVERHAKIMVGNRTAVIESKEEAKKNDTLGVVRVRRASLIRPPGAD